MRSTKTISALALAASLAAGMTLTAGTTAAFARNNGDSHHDNGDHNDHGNNGGSMKDHGNNSGKNTTNKNIRTSRKSSKHPPGITKITIKPIINKDPKPTANGTTTTTTTTAGKGTPTPTAGGSTLPANTIVVSNGAVKLNIPNVGQGLNVIDNRNGTITVTNGNPNQNVTLPGGSVTLSGTITGLSANSGIALHRQEDGTYTAASYLPEKTAPAPTPAKPVDTGTVTGGSGGLGDALHGLGSVVTDPLKDIISIGSPKPGTPGAGVKPPATSTTSSEPDAPPRKVE
jgi:hypothetical protein